MKPMLKAPGTKRLKLTCDILLSRFAFEFNLRGYNEGLVHGRASYSSTSRLNLSHEQWNHQTYPTKSAHVKPRIGEVFCPWCMARTRSSPTWGRAKRVPTHRVIHRV